MNEQDFKALYECDFKPDKRERKLLERLSEYYESTPDSIGNREAYEYWKEFKTWCSEHFYSQEETNRAKRDPMFRHI